jgi:hypothetical protein
VLKFTEPVDASPPTDAIYGLYPFCLRENKTLDGITLKSKDNLTSAFLIGRDEKICHILLEGTGCSK